MDCSHVENELIVKTNWDLHPSGLQLASPEEILVHSGRMLGTVGQVPLRAAGRRLLVVVDTSRQLKKDVWWSPVLTEMLKAVLVDEPLQCVMEVRV